MPSIDENHRATQFLPQNKCRNLNSQCLGQQPTSAAGDGGYYYFDCAIIIFSSHCLATFLTCLTPFPSAFTDGVTHTAPKLSKIKLCTALFTSLSWLLSWLFGCLLCLACKTELFPHHCWYKATPSLMGYLSADWNYQFPAQGSQKVAELLVSSIRMLQSLTGVLCR